MGKGDAVIARHRRLYVPGEESLQVDEFPQEVVAAGIAEVVERGVIRADAVRQICLRQIQPETPAPLAGAPAVEAPIADPRRYDALLAAGGMAR